MNKISKIAFFIFILAFSQTVDLNASAQDRTVEERYLTLPESYLLQIFGDLNTFTQETLDESIISEDWPALHQAIVRKDYDTVLEILDSPVLSLQYSLIDTISEISNTTSIPMKNLKNKINQVKQTTPYSALELAILFDAPTEIIEKLITLGANVNHKRTKIISSTKDVTTIWSGEVYYELRTPLLAAWIKKNDAIIQLLLENGANPDQVIAKGYEEFYHNEWTRDSTDIRHWIKLNDLSEEINYTEHN